MSDNYSYNYLFIAVFTIVAIIFPLLPIVLAKFVAPKKPSAIKNATYECGVETKGETWIQFRVQYYLFALLRIERDPLPFCQLVPLEVREFVVVPAPFSMKVLVDSFIRVG